MTSRIVSATATIDAPAEVIFAILADPQQHTRIDGSGTVQGVVEGPTRLSQGATFGMKMKQGAPYKITSRVIEFEEARTIAWQHPLKHVWRYELEPVEQGTRVTESFDYSGVNGIQAKLFEVVGFPKKNRKGIEGTLVRLADAAQADAGRGSGE